MVRWAVLSLVGMMLCALPASPLWADETTEPEVVCSNIAPFVFVEQELYRGYAYEIGQEVMRRLGYRGAIQVQPLARANRTVQSKPNVIALWVGRIPEREATVHWLYPVVVDDFSIYTVWLITSCRSANNIMPITIFLPAFIASFFYSA